MPATTPGTNKGKPEDNGKFRFAKCELTIGMRQDLKRWREDGAEPAALLEWVSGRINAGHTLGLKSQPKGFMATLTGVREQSGHMDVCLTARGSTPENALYALQYKDQKVLKGNWEAVDWESEFDL